jgi:hypothetical protein
MGTLKTLAPDLQEYLTESLDELNWWAVLRLIIQFLHESRVSKVHVKFGFVLDLDGKDQGIDQTVEIDQLESFISDGLANGTIERKGMSDFVFSSEDGSFFVMLCNDADVHFASNPNTLAPLVCARLESLNFQVFGPSK